MRRTFWSPPSTRPHRWLHSTPSHSQRWQENLARFLTPLTLWICVSVILRYGYFGDSRLVLGPGSSRLVEAGSVFVKQIEVKDYYNSEVLVYALEEKPELIVQANWSASNFLVVAAYSRKGFSLWLNRGSTIRMGWEAPARYLNQLEGVVIKGERKFERLQPKQTSLDAIADPGTIYGKGAEYLVEEDDRYHIGVQNMNGGNVILTMNVNVSAMVYDTSKAKKLCSTANGLCRLSLLFPHTHYLTLMTTNNGVHGDWSVEVSFVARVLTYIALLGFIVAVIFLILRYLGACGDDRDQSTNVMSDTYHTSVVTTSREVTETEPMLPVKTKIYGTNEEEDDDDNESRASSTSSEELYDEKLCVICYDELRNCFFIPCGHCATCYDCAQRIMDGDSKVCPICRRLIHKPRRLFHS
ncbi:E3 ubiquitin-protein ligase APD2-like [Prosopis cineraria]|uniref:E3 ubiquitin-protein ligase APD2-like n=1 Tax=Prosopis cineraria TaxID=364024 RepID=UPI00240FF8FD|nr:E3 ubiquitin-protein ligase APD2-like [Prosopis cineraria]